MSNLTRTLSLLLIFVCGTAVGLAQEKKQSKKKKKKEPLVAVIEELPPIGLGAPQWQEYESESGDFSIMFPGTPQEETTKRLSGGQEVPAHFLKFEGSETYTLMHLDTPTLIGMNTEATQNLLDAAVKKAIAMFQATTLEQKKITLDGHPGISCVMRMHDGRILRLRVYAIRGRFYQLMILTPPKEGATGKHGRSYEATANKFFDSFKIVPPVSGPRELRAASVEASRKARFTLTRLSGQPVKVSGLLTYNFVLP